MMHFRVARSQLLCKAVSRVVNYRSSINGNAWISLKYKSQVASQQESSNPVINHLIQGICSGKRASLAEGITLGLISNSIYFHINYQFIIVPVTCRMD